MFDVTVETPVPLAEATKLVPPARSGKRTHLSTLLRWILHGVKGPGGAVVRLEAMRLGSRWFTSREAVQRFSEKLTPQICERSQPPRSPTARNKASQRAARALEQIGI
jgi:hypothetical protein